MGRDDIHPECGQEYKYNMTTTVTTLEKDGVRYSFDMDDKVFIRTGDSLIPLVENIFEPREGSNVLVAEEYPDGSYVLECDDFVRFRDDRIIDRTAVYEVLSRIGISCSMFEAGRVLEIMRIWPEDESNDWSPSNYLDRIVERMREFLTPYGGSHNGYQTYTNEFGDIYEILFGPEVAKFVYHAVEDAGMRFEFYVSVETYKHHKWIELYVNGEPVAHYMEQYNISVRRPIYQAFAGTEEYQKKAEEEAIAWWDIHYHDVWREKHAATSKLVKEANEDYLRFCQERGLDPGEEYKSGNSGLSALLGAANASSN